MKLKNYNTHGDYRFDLDLEKGQFFEKQLYDILTGESSIKIELKADRFVSETNNLAIEFRCRGKLSGISTSEAEWYGFVLGGHLYNDEVIVLIKTNRLKKIVKSVYKKFKNKAKVMGGDENLSEMILIDVYDLLRADIK